MQYVTPNSPLQSLALTKTEVCLTSAGAYPDAPKSKGRDVGRPRRLTEGTVIHRCRNLRLLLTVTPMCLPQIRRDLKGLEERISHPCILCSPKLISFPGSGNGIGQRHLAAASWDFGDGWDEPLLLTRLPQAGSTGELPACHARPNQGKSRACWELGMQ